MKLNYIKTNNIKSYKSPEDVGMVSGRERGKGGSKKPFENRFIPYL
jgi:hypothetical protein